MCVCVSVCTCTTTTPFSYHFGYMIYILPVHTFKTQLHEFMNAVSTIVFVLQLSPRLLVI